MFKKLRLATKLNLIVGVTLAAIISFSGYINFVFEEKLIIDTMVRTSQRVAHAMVDDLEKYMFEREIENMHTIMKMHVTEQASIQKLMLINSDGRVTLSTEKNEIGKVLEKRSHSCNVCHVGSEPLVMTSDKDLSKMLMSDAGKRYLTVIKPIYNKQGCYTAPCHVHPQSTKVLGIIKTDFSLDEVNQTIFRRRLQNITTVLAAIMAISVVIALFIRKYVSRPIDALLGGMEKAAGGDLESRINIKNRDEIGKLAKGFNKMTGDLSQRAKELRETRDYLVGIVENSADLIITVNPDGYIETFNRGAEQILGYDRSEVIGKKIEMLFARPQEREAAINQLEHRDNVRNYETQFLRKDKAPVDVILTLSRLRDPKGNPIGTFGISKDVTDYKRLQNQLVQAECLAAIGQATASIIHSIKNILNSLKGGSYMIKTGLAKDKLALVQDGWEVAQTGIDKISDLAQEMLDFSKTQKSSIEPCSVNDIVAEVCWATTKTSEVQTLVDVTWDLDAAIPLMMIDRRTIYNAVLNLVSNAIDACNDREYEKRNYPWVKVKTYLEREASLVSIEVSDNGGGISDELREKVFTPFFSTKFYKGTGLGLAITMKIVQEHNGTISLDALPGQGSTFTIKLPVNYQEEEKGES
jgi:PAS domain S-box-containing protein